MRSFIAEVAEGLYARYGDDVSSLYMLFPNRRAGLFFCDALSRIAPRPLWQPRFVSMGETMQQIAGMRCSDNVKLIAELYKIYARYHNESFDTFYFWGDMLLADFDQIDKYLIDADMLFTNIGDLRELEDDYSYLTPDQIRVIARFWRSFGLESGFSDEKKRFMTIWRSLSSVYREFREGLRRQGLAYDGMVYRAAAERLVSDEAVPLPGEPDARYVVVGFNALSECEKKLFSRLKNSGRAEFYWDYDSYYVENRDFEAGLFLRENIRNYPPPRDTFVTHDHFRRPKETVVVSAPSDSLQCKYVHTFLRELIERGAKPDKETAIVLTDESLLLPVLYSIPEEIGAVNVTMGYPLRQTTAYSFVERLIELQNRKRIKGDRVLFYHSDAIGLLNHPFVRECEPSAVQAVENIRRARSVYVRADMLGTSEILSRLFIATDGWEELSSYVRDVLSSIASRTSASGDTVRRREFFTVIIDRICRIENSLRDCGLEVTVSVFASLMRKVLQVVRIPYEGEPLAGVQIMGILETRNLDFENVLILSVNDDTFPGNRAVVSSFVPHNLRYAYGLPTPQHHEGVYAYYFYRLLQRASRVHLAYCSRSDDKHTGEPSRYIYQLDYESPHELHFRNIPLGADLSRREAPVVPKTGRVAETLSAYLDGGGRNLSPTTFYRYVECPLKFYFHSVAGLRPEDEIAEEIDLPMFGTILHRAMELLYTPLLDRSAPQTKIGELIGSPEVGRAVMQAINEEYLHDSMATEDEYGGQIILVRDVVTRYIDRCILPFDVASEGFVLHRLEEPVECTFAFGTGASLHSVVFAGKADRIDLLTDGTLRVVDYKTGRQRNRFRDVNALFRGDVRERSSAVLQTLLYSLMLYTERRCDVRPALYYVRSMTDSGFSPLLVEGDRPVLRFSDYRESLTALLDETLSEMFDFSKPFEPCRTPEVCAFCDFREICRR